MRRVKLAATAVALLLFGCGSITASAGPATADDPCERIRTQVAAESAKFDAAIASGVLTSGERTQITRGRAINAAALRHCEPVASPTPSAPPSTIQPPPPSTEPTTPTPSPTPSPTPPAAWPGPDNTGVPVGTVLSAYSGPCTITAADTIIDAKTVSCTLEIQTTGVVVTRSRLLGISGGGFRVEDSTIDASPDTTLGVIADGISGDNYVALRVDVSGSNRGIYCRRNATIQDSWIHGTEINPTSAWHASAVRMEQGCTIVHNALACDWLTPTPADGGCSADLTGYPDFAPIKDNLIQGNLFVANPTGAAFCAYGGATPGKPYSGDPTNATNIRFVDNVFERGGNGNCAAYGPVDSYAAGRPGNLWSGNVWSPDGAVVVP